MLYAFNTEIVQDKCCLDKLLALGKLKIALNAVLINTVNSVYITDPKSLGEVLNAVTSCIVYFYFYFL